MIISRPKTYFLFVSFGGFDSFSENNELFVGQNYSGTEDKIYLLLYITGHQFLFYGWVIGLRL